MRIFSSPFQWSSKVTVKSRAQHCLRSPGTLQCGPLLNSGFHKDAPPDTPPFASPQTSSCRSRPIQLFQIITKSNLSTVNPLSCRFHMSLDSSGQLFGVCNLPQALENSSSTTCSLLKAEWPEGSPCACIRNPHFMPCLVVGLLIRHRFPCCPFVAEMHFS